MAITDIFRAKHKHSDPEVRAQAIHEIDDAGLLAAIAREDDAAAVRRLAIDRIADPEALAAIADAETDDGVREHARRRAADLWLARAASGNPDTGRAAVDAVARMGDTRALVELVKRSGPDQVRREALDRIDDHRALADVARSAAPTDLRVAAIQRIDDGEILRAIAIDDTHKDAALAAVSRLADRSVLELVAQKAKIKAVRARARRALDGFGDVEAAFAPPSDADRRLYAEQIQLCQNVEALATRHEWVETLAQIEAAEVAWDALGGGGDVDLARRFRAACREYRNRRTRYARESELAAARGEPAPSDGSEVPAAGDVQADYYAHANERDHDHVHVHVHVHEHELEQEHEHEHEPDHDKRRAKIEERERNLAALDKLVRELEDIEGLKKIKSAERKLHAAEQGHAGLGPLPGGRVRVDLEQRYVKARQQLVIKIQELREADEWQRWANVPLREELVARAEQMAADEDETRLGERLHELQVAWKQLGPVPHKKGQELWDKFKAACDQVYERVKVQRKAASEERSVNLDRKRELVERAEALAESTDWERTAEELKRLQAEWKAVGPVPRKQGDQLWARFRGACDQFFARRKPQLDEKMEVLNANLADKLALCERAETLAESTDWDDAAEQLKRMQRQWRDIGHVPRRESQAVYDRFRSACDRFFARLEEHRDQLRTEKERVLTDLAAAIEAAGQALRDATAAAEEIVPRVIELRGQVLGLEVGSREQRARLVDEVAALCKQAVDAHPDGFKGTELDPTSSRKRKEKLIARAEAISPPPPAAPAGPLTAEQMAAQLRAALSDRALGGVLSKAGGRPAAEQVAELRESWARLGPVPGAEGEELERRFAAACARATGSAD